MRVGPFKLDETRLLVARGYAVECTLHLFRGPGACPSLQRYEEDPAMRQEVAELIASAAVLQLEPAIVSMPGYNLHCKREPVDIGSDGPEGVLERVYRHGVEVSPCPWRYTFVIEALDSSGEGITPRATPRKSTKRMNSASAHRSFDSNNGNSASVVRRSSTLFSGTSSAFSSTSRFATPSITPQKRSRSATKRRATERPTYSRVPARSTKTGRINVIPSDDSFFTTDDDERGARDTFGLTGGRFGSSVRFTI